MINDNSFDKIIGQKIIEANKLKSEKHKSSGKLSASILGWPLQWQVLNHYGVQQPKFDEYTLRKFLRGNHVEAWVISMLDNVIDKQKFVEYKGVVGYLDLTIKHGGSVSQLKGLVIPHEIKSVTNANFRNILRTKQAKPQHQLQAGFYAMAMGSKYYAIDYIASDDLRLETYIYETAQIKPEIEKIIADYDEAIKSKTIPVFVPRYDWQKNIKYANYPEFMALTKKELEAKKNDIIK